MTMQVERVEEFAIKAETEALASALLHQSFPTYPASRSYFKLRPHFRYLVWSNRLLVGHMAVDHRVIRVGDSVSTAFGVIDLCIAPPFRRRGLASQLLKLLETLAHRIKLHYAEGPANGVPLVLIHGGSARWQSWGPLMPALVAHTHVFALDLRGHGRSGWRVPYTLEEYTDDLVSFRHHCVGEPAIVCGHSLGGMIALLTAARISSALGG